MTVNLNEPSATLILLDIEGTTTPIDFVYKTLFPFARARVKDYLSRAWDELEIQTDLTQLRAERAADAAQGLNPPAIECESSTERLESTVAYIHWLMDRDRKSTPLKAIQGRIWREGYEAGELLGEVFDDVPPAKQIDLHLLFGQRAGAKATFRPHDGGRPDRLHLSLLRHHRRPQNRGGQLPEDLRRITAGPGGSGFYL